MLHVRRKRVGVVRRSRAILCRAAPNPNPIRFNKSLYAQVTKACKVTVDRTGAFPKLKFENRESYEVSRRTRG